MFRKVSICLITFTFLLAVICPVTSTAQVAEGISAVAAIESVESLSKTLTKDLGNEMSAQQRQLYTRMLNFLAVLKGQLADLLGDVDSKIDAKLRMALNTFEGMKASLVDQSKTWQEKSETITSEISNAATKIVFSDRTPSPIFFDMPVITKQQSKVVPLVVKGKRLNHKKNFIAFNGRKINVSSIKSETEILFNIPLNSSDTFSPYSTNSYSLVLFKKRFLRSPKAFEYNPVFSVAPQLIGTFRIHYKGTDKSISRLSNLTDIVHATSGGRKTVDVTRQFFLRNAEYLIDINSIKCWKEKGNGKKHGYGGPYDITIGSFTAKAFAKDGKATCRCTWDEIRTLDTESDRYIDVVLGYNQQQIIQFPTNYSRYLYTEVFNPDGTVYRDAESNFSKGFATFKLNETSKIISVVFDDK